MAGRGGNEPTGFGSRLRVVREGKALTQRQLGEIAGVHWNTIAKLERGDQEPNWPLVLKFAKALGVTCEAFSDDAEIVADVQQGNKSGASGQPTAAAKRKGKK